MDRANVLKTRSILNFSFISVGDCILTDLVPSEYSFLVRKHSSHAGRQLKQVEAFPVLNIGPREGIVYAAPARLTTSQHTVFR